MRIGVLSDTVMPTKPQGGHGLGRVAYDLAKGLDRRGHQVTLYAGPGSVSNVAISVHSDEYVRARELDERDQDVWFDLSHSHILSENCPEWPIVNYVLDAEWYNPPTCAAVPTETDRVMFIPNAKVLPMGIDVDAVPFHEQAFASPLSYLAFAAKIHPLKGYEHALYVHRAQNVPVHFAGKRYADAPLPNYRGELVGIDFHNYLGRALGLLQCGIFGIGGGRVQLDAAALGTPTLCFDTCCAHEHVEHGVSGFWCADEAEMADAAQDLALLPRKRIREWVKETHDLKQMVEGAEKLIGAVLTGERW